MLYSASLFLLLLLARVLPAEGTAPAKAVASAGAVHLLTYEGVINPVSSELFVTAIANAEQAKAQALILQLDTPGGLDTSMREIVKAMISSEVPIIVHVYPSGGRAASAGVFITMAAHLAAMTPGTNMGAAHPVAMGGTLDEETKKKVENDAAAYIRSIAEQRGRDPQWAEEAVRKSVSVTARQALKLKLIDVIAEDVTDLLLKIDGKTVKTARKTLVLATREAVLIRQEIGFRHKVLKAISDPNVAYILMLLGTTGLLAELYSPGAIFPGVVGAICLLLAFYAFQTLSVNYVGLLLILLAVILFIAEILVSGFGVLALGGITSLLIGSLMLFDAPLPALRLSPWVLFSSVLMIGLLAYLLIHAAWLAQRRKPAVAGGAGAGVFGEVGIAQSDIDPIGTLQIRGELWQAEADEPIHAGEKVEVISIKGFTLQVKKTKP